MAIITKSYEPTFWDRLYFPALIKGLMVTLRYFFKRKVTIQYPDEKYVPPDGYRGLHRLNKYPDGRIRCVACEMCSAACPADCIYIVPGPAPWEGGKERYPVKFDIDLLKCIFSTKVHTLSLSGLFSDAGIENLQSVYCSGSEKYFFQHNLQMPFVGRNLQN